MRRQALRRMLRHWPLLAITWCLHLGLGLSISMTGPTLPYLALNAGESLSNVSFVYTVRSAIVCITSVLTGFVIARLDSARSKLLLLLLGSLASMTSAIAVPHAKSMITLLLGQGLFGVSIGVVDTINNMLVIFLFGPVQSRPLSHSLHWCAGVGGFFAPVLARPFLVRMGDIGTDSSICGGGGGAESSDKGGLNSTTFGTTAPPVNLEPLRWPYLILAAFHVVWLLGYSVLLLRNYPLQKFLDDRNSKHAGKNTKDAETDLMDAATDTKGEGTDTKDSVAEIRTPPRLVGFRKAAVVALFVVFFFLHVGQENVFWGLLYSFGVCSRLRLSPGDASLLSTLFFIGFMVSRTLGIFLARLVTPTKILVTQLLGCLATTTALAIWGETNFTLALVVCCLYGFCIAMLFPTGITWLASKIDVTGSLASAWFFGAYIGNGTFPAVAGQLVTSSVGAIGIMYLAAATSGAFVVVVAVMLLLAR